MVQASRVNAGSSKTRREGYESVNYDASDEEYDFIERGNGSGGGSEDKLEGKRDVGIDVEQSSDDESSTEDGDRVKLLPLNKAEGTRTRGNGPTLTFDNAAASSSTLRPDDMSEENRDVGKAIEQVLQMDRTMMSESFDTDLEDGDHLILSDDDSDGYGVPGDKRRKKAQDGEGRNWRSGLRSILPLKAWWHVFPLAVVGLLVMWLATKGLSWLRSEPARGEYVRTLF